MRLCLEKKVMTLLRPHRQHLTSGSDLVTSYEATRAGFVSLALEKNRQATPFVQQARALKAAAAVAGSPLELLSIKDIEPALLVAAGISDKATGYLQASDKQEAVLALIRNYLEPQGENWVEELVYRFLLTRGDTLGGMMRNIAGVLAQRKMTRAIMAALAIIGQTYQWLDTSTNKWVEKPTDDADIELFVRGLSWQRGEENRTLVYNIKVPSVNKNVDLCLFNGSPKDFASGKLSKVTYGMSELYIALGELKGGIDPAGADEHWKTAQSALNRIQKAFMEKAPSPHLFFVGAAIEKDMANEIWHQLENGMLTNAANLTNEAQVAAICLW
jgi:hypothetical protein